MATIGMIFSYLLISLLFNVSDIYADDTVPVFKRQKFTAGTPENVVEEFMYKDFIAEIREDPNNNFEDLVTEAFAFYMAVGPWQGRFCIDYYRIVGVEYVVSNKASVNVEIYNRGAWATVYASEEITKRQKFNFGWLDLSIFDQKSGKYKSIPGSYGDYATLEKMLRKQGVVLKVTDKNSRNYVVDSDKRIWRFKVSVAYDSKEKRWELDLPTLFKHQSFQICKSEVLSTCGPNSDDVLVCTGQKEKPISWYEPRCTPKGMEKHENWCNQEKPNVLIETMGKE